ncbi:MAG: hypothetical protein MUE58_00645, partial [Chitinophagaceae bacterium]|nr:hypothetical protein [Chitinophagaceae bacterium]
MDLKANTVVGKILFFTFKNKIIKFFFFVFLVAGIFFRLYHVEFGLPHSFYADEPEIAELAIKYTYEFEDIFFNNNIYKLIPISYVYGTLPSYVFTVTTIVFSKFNGIIGHTIEKAEIYIFLRSLNA